LFLIPTHSYQRLRRLYSSFSRLSESLSDHGRRDGNRSKLHHPHPHTTPAVAPLVHALPAGDGQKLAVRFQANGASFQNYSLTFTEPWLGGKKPNSLSISLNSSISYPYKFRQSGYNSYGAGGLGGGYGGYGDYGDAFMMVMMALTDGDTVVAMTMVMMMAMMPIIVRLLLCSSRGRITIHMIIRVRICALQYISKCKIS
jgi:hypothetical protein